MQFNKKLNKIIVSTAADIKKNLDRSDEKPQDSNSIMGKTLIIDEENTLDAVKKLHTTFDLD